MFYPSILVALAVTASAASIVSTKRFTTRDYSTYVYDYAAAQDSKPTVLFIHGYPMARQDWHYKCRTSQPPAMAC